ncbi:tudor domain-containing protein 3 [Ceratitis capitata]|uniref:tudor domain-containing protein 3 n=1 Tax=Ceratitis capitata TaxID=7213 RepID=UPI000329B1C6|nr:tudor domain-containing protein 3 [Ceratitis capitata]
MDLSKKLSEQGWHLTDDGIKKITAAASNASGIDVNDVRKIIPIITDMDFREIAGGALPTKRDDNIPGRIVLQLQKTRNISAPKSNEDSKAAPRFLQLELTDGQTTINALELENVSVLNMNLPPGTKIYFRSERLQLMQGFLILRSSEIQVLGGRVEPLVEKWELARTMLKYARSGRRMSGASGPPPWIPFGTKVEASISNDRNFKSLQAAGADGKETKENEEFNAMRSEAIAEASKAGAKKVFGGGGQQMLDHNVKKILEKGFSEEDAKQALRTTNNNLERALYNLKRRGEMRRSEDITNAKNNPASSFMSAKTGRGGPMREISTGKRGVPAAKEEALAAKPAGNVSLFDFLTDKLPVDAVSNVNSNINKDTAIATPTPNITSNTLKLKKSDKIKKEVNKNIKVENTTPTESITDSNANSNRPRFENTMSSSFAANRSFGSQTNGPLRSERGGASSRGGRTSNERGRSSVSFNPFRDNDRAGHSLSGNQNQARNNRGSYERGKNTNSLGGDLHDGGNSSYAGKRSNERQQQPRNHGADERGVGQNEGRQRYNNKREGSSQLQNSSSVSTKNGTPQNSNANVSTQMNKLIEDTSKLKIADSKRSPRAGRSTSGESRSNTQYSQNYDPNQVQNASQLNNGYSYDTSKIIGFQNKETNEFAMTLLKSQGLGSSTSKLGTQPQQQSPSPKVNSQSKQVNDNYMSSVLPHTRNAQMSGYASHPSDYSTSNPNVPTVVPVPSHFGMVQGDGWHWKVGDLCFAKYWDDGRYYEAEVTAVSDKTCVVFYLGYGNHEEVLKSDCLPITDGNHCPVNNYNAAMPYSQPQQGKSNMVGPMLPPQQLQQSAYQRGGGGAQRFRGERQMYVPPHKREN